MLLGSETVSARSHVSLYFVHISALYPADGDVSASLYYSTTAGVTLNRKYPGHPNSEHEHASYQGFVEASEHGKHVIISSEPTTFDEKEWNLIPRNTMVLVDEHGEMKTTPATYDRGLDAVDPST